MFRRFKNEQLRSLQSFCIGSIFGFALIYIFLDIELLLLYIINSSSLSLIIEQSLLSVLIVIQFYILLTKKHSIYIYIYILIILWHVSISLLKGYDSRVIFQASSNDGFFLIILTWFHQHKWTRKGLTSILIALTLLHVLFVILEYLGITSSIVNTWTAYGSDNFQQGSRYTALFMAPGLLSFYSAIITAYAFADFKINKDYLSLILILLGIFLGISSGNRSYILASFFILIIIFFWSPKFTNYNKIKKRYLFIILSLILCFLLSIIYIYSEAILFLMDRFQYEIILEDLETRTTGSAGFVPILESLFSFDAIFGTTSSNPQNGLNGVFYEGNFYTLSNSYIASLASLGWFFGSIFLLIYFTAIKRYHAFTKVKYMNDTNNIATCLYFSMLASSVVLLFDNLINHVLIITIMMMAYSPKWKELKR